MIKLTSSLCIYACSDDVRGRLALGIQSKMASEGVGKSVEKSKNEDTKGGDNKETKEKKHRGIPEAGFLVSFYVIVCFVSI